MSHECQHHDPFRIQELNERGLAPKIARPQNKRPFEEVIRTALELVEIYYFPDKQPFWPLALGYPVPAL
jgi:hypothetical protein